MPAMSEDEIERGVERMTDAADLRYLKGDLTDDAYLAALAEIERWAKARRQ